MASVGADLGAGRLHRRRGGGGDLPHYRRELPPRAAPVGTDRAHSPDQPTPHGDARGRGGGPRATHHRRPLTRRTHRGASNSAEEIPPLSVESYSHLPADGRRGA